MTDARGASAYHKVSTGRRRNASDRVFTISPTIPAPNQDIFFNATASAPGAGRTITSYIWAFGDGSTGSGLATSHRVTLRPAQYQVQLGDHATMQARRATPR